MSERELLETVIDPDYLDWCDKNFGYPFSLHSIQEYLDEKKTQSTLEVKTAGLHFTIKLTPISKKNHQRIFRNPKTDKPFVMPSKEYKQYETDAMWFIPKGEVIDYPVNVKSLFYMPTKRKCDLVNMQESILDVMVKAGLLADDNYGIVQSMDGSRVLYDKEDPRTEVYITEVKNDDKAEA